jgi:putative NIF3 family GTP cyclohydrolase 1 type 2
MVSRETVVSWLNRELDTEHFNNVEEADFNGALVKGSEEVEKIGLSTNTTFENIEAAAEKGLDLVIVHHGGWERFDHDLLEEKKEKMREAGLTWYIAHQPLDCADEFGVCVALADKLGVEVDGKYCELQGGPHGRYGNLEVSKEEFLDRLEEVEPDHDIIGSLENVEDAKIGIVGGGGGAFAEIVKENIDIGCDVFITGNTMFANEIYAYEKGLTMVVLEETSSERWGVYALGEKLEEGFEGLEAVRIEERNW